MWGEIKGKITYISSIDIVKKLVALKIIKSGTMDDVTKEINVLQ
jgi:hypothetical protein